MVNSHKYVVYDNETTRQLLIAAGAEWLCFTTYWYDDETTLDGEPQCYTSDRKWLDIQNIPVGEWFYHVQEYADNKLVATVPQSFTVDRLFAAIDRLAWAVRDAHYGDDGHFEVHLPSSTYRQTATAYMSEPELTTFSLASDEIEDVPLDFTNSRESALLTALGGDKLAPVTAPAHFSEPVEEKVELPSPFTWSVEDQLLAQQLGYTLVADGDTKKILCGERLVADLSSYTELAFKLHAPQMEAMLRDMGQRQAQLLKFVETPSNLWAALNESREYLVQMDARETAALLWPIDQVAKFVVELTYEYDYFPEVLDMEAYDTEGNELVKTYPGLPESVAAFEAEYDEPEATPEERQAALDDFLLDEYDQLRYNLALPSFPESTLEYDFTTSVPEPRLFTLVKGTTLG